MQATAGRLLVCSVGRLRKPLQAVTFPLVGIQKGFVFRSPEGELKAFANVCAHRGLELDFDDDEDFFDESSFIRCKVHDAKFDHSGVCLKGPKSCINKKLWDLSVHVEGDDVYVSGIPSEMLDFRKHFKSPEKNTKEYVGDDGL